MNSYLRGYEKILGRLIKKSFPGLKDKKIYLKEKDAPWRAHVSYFPWGLRILMSYKLRGLPKKIAKRVLIHELCHLEIFLKWGVIRTNLNFIIYLFSKPYRKELEREANMLMIKKGYGKLVLDARKDSLKRGIDYPLSEKEIKGYIKEHNKR